MYIPENPLIVQSDRSVLCEVHSPRAEAAREAISPINCKREDAEEVGDRDSDAKIPLSLAVSGRLLVTLPGRDVEMVTKQYVEQREGGYWITGSRVSLDSIVYAFLNGMSPESIAQAFPVLTLEKVYGAITFYLANRMEIDAYLEAGEVAFEEMRQSVWEANSLLYKKLADAQMLRS